MMNSKTAKKVKRKIKKRMPPKSTPRQKKLAKSMLANIGKQGKTVPLKKLMKEAGYSDAIAKNPQMIVKSKSFMDLLDYYGVSDDNLAKVAADGLMLKGKSMACWRVKHQFLESGLKLRKHLNPLGEELIDAFKNMVQIHLPAHEPLPDK